MTFPLQSFHSGIRLLSSSYNLSRFPWRLLKKQSLQITYTFIAEVVTDTLRKEDEHTYAPVVRDRQLPTASQPVCQELCLDLWTPPVDPEAEWSGQFPLLMAAHLPCSSNSHTWYQLHRCQAQCDLIMHWESHTCLVRCCRIVLCKLGDGKRILMITLSR